MQIKFDEDAMRALLNKDRRYGLNKYLKDNNKYLNDNKFTTLYNNLWKNHRYNYNRWLSALLILSDIPFLNYMKYIPRECFRTLPIESIIIPNNIIGIKDNAFDNCTKLRTIFIPKSVKAVGTAFNWSNMKTVYYEGTEEEFESINGCRYIFGGGPFINIKYNSKISDIGNV